MTLATKADSPVTIRDLFRRWRAAQHRANTATLTDDAACKALFDAVDDLERAAFTLTPQTPADVTALAIKSFEHDDLDQGRWPPPSTDAGRFLALADRLLAETD